MGLFSDTCRALIDPKTGFALTGAALEAARQNPAAPRCGQKVRKAARYCGKCGAGAPGGWWQCGYCQKWIGNESNFCWNCKKPQHAPVREAMAGGSWQRTPGVFAERFEEVDIHALLKKGLFIEQGTLAILLQGGALKDVLEAGRHNLESLAHKVNYWGDPPPRTVILVESGDVVLPLHIEGLRASNEIPLEFYSEVALRFLPKEARAFVDNLYKQGARLTYADLEAKLIGEIRYAVDNVCNRSTVEDLIKDPQRRLDVEDEIRKTFEKNLARYGLELVRLASAEFTGKEYEELREKAGALEIKRQEIEFTQRMRELLSSDRMHELVTQHKLDEYVAQLAQERGISDEKRQQELGLLKQADRHELEKNEVDYRMAREIETAAHQIGIKVQWDDYTRDKLAKDTRLQIDLKAAAADEEIRETMGWLKVKEEKLRIKSEDLRRRAETLKDLDFKALIAVLPPDKHASLLALSEQASKQGRSAAEILALEAGKNPALAQVLLEAERQKGGERDREWTERKQLLNDMADRMERIMKAALETTSEAARHPGSSTTHIVK